MDGMTPLHCLDNPFQKFPRLPLFAENEPSHPAFPNAFNLGTLPTREWGLQTPRPFLVPPRGETLTGNRLSFMARTAGRSVEVFVGIEGSLWRMVDPLLDDRACGQQVICNGEDAPHWIAKYAVIADRYRMLRLYSMRSGFAEAHVRRIDASAAEVAAIAREQRSIPVQENSVV